MTYYRIAVDGDLYAVGYEGNWFASHNEAAAAIDGLRSLGPDWLRDGYSVVSVRIDEMSARDREYALACGLEVMP